MESHYAHFSIDGEGFTRIARDFLLSGDPAQAWRLISNGLIGIDDSDGESVARAILDGRMKLVTSPSDPSVLETEDDDDEAFRKDVHFIYAGRFRVADGSWWRPVATIAAFGTQAKRESALKLEAFPEMRENPTWDWSVGNPLAGWAAKCAEWYTGPRERATWVPSGDKPRAGRWIIWEACGEPPHWWEPHKTMQAAIADCEVAGRRLDVRGGEEPREIFQDMAREKPPEEIAEIRRVYESDTFEYRQKKHEEALERIGNEVREKAGDDTFVLKTEDGREIVVPRAPFMRWALERTSLRHLAPEWKTVAPSGLKIAMDSPSHSDWMLGAGLNLYSDGDYGFNSPVQKAANDEMFRLQEELGKFEAAVLVDNGPVEGVVGETIAVLPDLSEKHTEVAMRSKAIITERGGAMAHLAVIGLEQGWTIMRVPDARKRYPAGLSLSLSPSNGIIRTWQT